MHQVGHIVGDIAIALNQHGLALGGDRRCSETLALQVQLNFCGGVRFDQAQGRVFVDAAPGVRVELAVDQFHNGGESVARHTRRFTARGGNHPFAHN